MSPLHEVQMCFGCCLFWWLFLCCFWGCVFFGLCVVVCVLCVGWGFCVGFVLFCFWFVSPVAIRYIALLSDSYVYQYLLVLSGLGMIFYVFVYSPR